MKRIFATLCGLLLALSLAACEGPGDSRQPPDAVSAENNRQASFRVAESSQPAERKFTEDGGQIEDAPAENQATGQFIGISAADGGEIIFQLNESSAASSFYRQLPLSIWVEDYAGSEKIFYPPEKLGTDDAPPAQGPAGTLAYYAPWGNVAVFYGECGAYSGLYELGEAVSGVESISALTGEVRIEAVDAPPASAGPAETESEPSPPPLSPSPDVPATQEPASEITSEERTAMKMNLQVGNSTFTATLEENAAVDSFVALMEAAPVVIQMSDYAGFEKVGSLGTSLPASNIQTTTQAGDIVLYNGNQIVIFYGSNSWSYTRLGRIDDLTGWEEALGNGDVTVTFSVGNTRTN